MNGRGMGRSHSYYYNYTLIQVGPVLSLKLIQDPVSGKPRGFGFCEYEDAETALSACRNLAGRELNGRPLRIDSAMNAPGESFRSAPVPQGPIEPPLHGPAIPPENAPESITKAVASLPPEHMYELMKQVKWCIQNNPQETRQLLLHNPQLAYALLQAQVVMRIVDLETAQNLLHRTPRAPPIPSSAPPPNHHHHEDRFRSHPPMRDPPPGRDSHRRDWYQPPNSGPSHPPRGGPSHPPLADNMSHEDQEKAALLMQVLSLTDEQIQMLPPDQRNNILRLKEQLSHAAGP